MRDEAIHLFISEVPKDVLGLLQACVLNYHDCLSDWFGVTLSERVPIGMMTIVFDTSPEQLDLANPVMRRRLGKDAADYLTSLTQELRDEHDAHGYAPQFSVEIEYSLHIQKKPEGAAVLAVTGEDGIRPGSSKLREDPWEEYPFRQGELVAELNERLRPSRRITSGDVQAVVVAEHVKQRPEWFFQSKVPNSPSCYSRRFVDWFVTRYQQQPDWLSRSRDVRRASLRAKLGSVSPARSLWTH